jgi:hypothetical protein
VAVTAGFLSLEGATDIRGCAAAFREILVMPFF